MVSYLAPEGYIRTLAFAYPPATITHDQVGLCRTSGLGCWRSFDSQSRSSINVSSHIPAIYLDFLCNCICFAAPESAGSRSLRNDRSSLEYVSTMVLHSMTQASSSGVRRGVLTTSHIFKIFFFPTRKDTSWCPLSTDRPHSHETP